MIELKRNGDIDVKKLTPEELESLADMMLDHHQRVQEHIIGELNK